MYNDLQSLFFLFVGKILLFYTVFYIGLAGFFAGLLAIFWQTLDYERPKWQLSQSIIGTNPGLGFRPMPPEAHLGSTLIWYKSNRPDNMIYWHDTVNKFLEGKLLSATFSVRNIYFLLIWKKYIYFITCKVDYIDPKHGDSMDVSCTYDRPATEGKFCEFKIDSLDNCSPGKTNQKYGFPEKKPCVYLKLNKVRDWTNHC